LNIVVGASLFIYGFNDAELRRSGTMRPSQSVKRLILDPTRATEEMPKS
jgi:hypothetical protein